jgi:hypothetical protein
MTTVLPVGGTALSGCVILIFVGAAVHCFNAAAAAPVAPEAEVAPELPDAAGAAELDALEELVLLEEPQAASARQSTSVPMIAVRW